VGQPFQAAALKRSTAVPRCSPQNRTTARGPEISPPRAFGPQPVV
jgi:hypothetical protein